MPTLALARNLPDLPSPLVSETWAGPLTERSTRCGARQAGAPWPGRLWLSNSPVFVPLLEVGKTFPWAQRWCSWPTGCHGRSKAGT